MSLVMQLRAPAARSLSFLARSLALPPPPPGLPASASDFRLVADCFCCCWRKRRVKLGARSHARWVRDVNSLKVEARAQLSKNTTRCKWKLVPNSSKNSLSHLLRSHDRRWRRTKGKRLVIWGLCQGTGSDLDLAASAAARKVGRFRSWHRRRSRSH